MAVTTPSSIAVDSAPSDKAVIVPDQLDTHTQIAAPPRRIFEYKRMQEIAWRMAKDTLPGSGKDLASAMDEMLFRLGTLGIIQFPGTDEYEKFDSALMQWLYDRVPMLLKGDSRHK